MELMRWTLVLAVVAGCGKSDPKPPPPVEPPKEEAKPPPPKVIAPAGDAGTCTLSVTGSTTLDETTPADAQTKYWMSEAESGSTPQPGFVVSCKGTKVRLSLVTSPNASIEFKAKDYQVAGKNPDVSILGRVSDKPLQDFAGKVSITAFDASHIAGTFDLTAKPQSGTGRFAIMGTFDVKCTRWGKCNH